MATENVLARVKAADALVLYRLDLSPTDGSSALRVAFEGPSGRTVLRFANPWPLDATFALTDDRGDIVVADTTADQWEQKKVKVEFFTEANCEFWADSVEVRESAGP